MSCSVKMLKTSRNIEVKTIWLNKIDNTSIDCNSQKKKCVIKIVLREKVFWKY